ncbi:hypothetical protein BAE44_0019481 [Dichanthelium oligosanthes]|uniref:rRNA-processing protein EFG1 n=1 Tax=Dichanthelium oligosanthes TaxID=888268 RepID=A0A1E5V2W8_9POAL|nr:hypothetical protein BAE44_0019481 [Dichanthelium oligosanthes]
MAHGGYPRRGAAVRRPKSSPSAAVADRKRKRTAAAKTASLKNQIRSTERFLRKDLPDDIRIAQEKKLEELKRQQELQNQLAVQRTVQLRDRKIKFFGLLLLNCLVPIHLWFLLSAHLYLQFS